MGTIAAAAESSDPAPAPLILSLPLACELGRNCWVANYVDMDPTRAAADFRCEPRTYDNHGGTDFAIRDRAVMEEGMAVLAAAAGIVSAARGGMPD